MVGSVMFNKVVGDRHVASLWLQTSAPLYFYTILQMNNNICGEYGLLHVVEKLQS